MNQVALCRMMCWTWDEFERQPAWFIEMMISLLKHQKEQERKQQK